MKVIYSFILIEVLLCIESCCLVCPRLSNDTPVECSRLIVNRLEQDIDLKIYSPFSLDVGNIKRDNIWLMEKIAIVEEFEPFDFLNANIDSVVVYALDGKTLKVWRKSEQNEEGHHFFDESSHKKREWEDRKYTYYEWTFELLPEDIQGEISGLEARFKEYGF